MSNILAKMGMALKVSFTEWGTQYAWIDNFYTYLNPILYAVMALVCAAGAVYGIILGVNLARAEDTSKREEAKKHLITVLVSVFVTIGLVLFFNEILPLIIQAFLGKPNA